MVNSVLATLTLLIRRPGLFVQTDLLYGPTDKVGNDAREHFDRRREVTKDRFRGRPHGEPIDEPLYIEGLEDLRTKLGALATELAAKDAEEALADLLPMAAIGAAGLIRSWVK